ncbi:hypothetical protein F4804DRAFT_306346 [Jackrogersella minutella]|nr:hypothetical protein F4804DRAFT_306346 [Jackrogersella minutella]
MKVLRSLLATLTLLASTAWAIPHTHINVTVHIPIPIGVGRSSTITAPQTKTARSTEAVTLIPITVLGPPAVDSSTSSFTGQCDYSYCDEQGDNVCFYWAGVTSWDVSLGPIPGEIPTTLGPCSTAT